MRHREYLAHVGRTKPGAPFRIATHLSIGPENVRYTASVALAPNDSSSSIFNNMIRREPTFTRSKHPTHGQPTGTYAGVAEELRPHLRRQWDFVVREPHRLARVGRPLAGDFGEFHCKLGQGVQIEPGLQRESPENGNNSMNSRRLSAISSCHP